ncbi:hypothetical protein [Pseudomonas nunensis]|uniref:hypothetical protein n=1 Tax=Pseudomonas nunensis TaxID=2961896 RepID=UPI0006B4FFB5|nr:hypothetical protein [Pseudomonas nunensis]KOX98536.1 hypothetical protein AM274_30640 [Pseudomonas nunensis]
MEINDKGLFDRITLANRVIKVVQGLLGDTPLNRRGKLEEVESLTVDVLGDMNTFFKVVAVREYLHTRSDQLRTRPAQQRHETRVANKQIRAYDPTETANRPKVVLGSLSVPGSKGMCQEYAALTYGLLRYLLPQTDKVCYVYEDHIKHYFCTIGDHDTRDSIPENLIVVDAWYTKSEAVLWKDSDHKNKGYTGSAIYCKPGKSAVNFNEAVVNEALARDLIAKARHSYMGRFMEENYERTIQGRINEAKVVQKSPATLVLHDRNQYPGHMSTFARSDNYVGYEFVAK